MCVVLLIQCLCGSILLQVVKGEGNRSGYAHAHPISNGSKWSREERYRSNANGFWSTNKRCVLFSCFVNLN